MKQMKMDSSVNKKLFIENVSTVNNNSQRGLSLKANVTHVITISAIDIGNVKIAKIL